MKLISILILAFIILSSISSAQQEEITTINDPSQLRQIFEFRQEGHGTVQLYKTVQGRELSLGSLQGIINANTQLSLQSITVRNGNYNFVNDENKFNIFGDMIIQKSQNPNNQYPEITLLNGTVESFQMQFSCNRQTPCTMMINTNTGIINLIGESKIYKPRTETLKPAEITAKNLQIKPSNMSKITKFNISFKVTEEEYPESQIGKFRLAPGSEGKFLILDSDNIETQLISGNVHVLELTAPTQETFVHDGRNDLVLDYNGEELVRLKQRLFVFGKDVIAGTKFCQTRIPKPTCFNFNQNTGEASIYLRKSQRLGVPTKLILNLDNEAITKINLYQFAADNTESFLIAKKPSLGNRKILFKYDNVLVDGNWEDFGISFSAFIYRPTERTHDLLECKLEEHKCYMNGQPVTLGRSAQTILRCRTDAECENGLVCTSNRCIESRNCRLLIESQSADPIGIPIDILFLGDGISSFNELETIARSELYGINGLFRTEPFNTYQDRFNIWLQTSPPLSTNLLYYSDGTREFIPTDIGIENCPEKDVTIIVSKRAFTPNAIPGTCRITIGSSPEPLTNRLLVHEFGHCFGDLSDEYHSIYQNQNSNPRPPNCITPARGENEEQIALREWSNLIGSAEARKLVNDAKISYRGCGGRCDDTCNNYLRPSMNSVMNNHVSNGNYNKISRIWLERKILNEVIR